MDSDYLERGDAGGMSVLECFRFSLHSSLLFYLEQQQAILFLACAILLIEGVDIAAYPTTEATVPPAAPAIR